MSNDTGRFCSSAQCSRARAARVRISALSMLCGFTMPLLRGAQGNSGSSKRTGIGVCEEGLDALSDPRVRPLDGPGDLGVELARRLEDRAGLVEAALAAAAQRAL